MTANRKLGALLGLGVAGIVFSLPQLFRHMWFDTPLLWWLGLAPTYPPSMDYEPLFPWFGAFLLGMAAAKVVLGRGPMTYRVAAPWIRRLSWVGRHSLLIYLLHQPVLMGLFITYLRLNG